MIMLRWSHLAPSFSIFAPAPSFSLGEARTFRSSALDSPPPSAFPLFRCVSSQGIAVLAYGVLAGGFLTDAWLGKPEPTENLSNRSLIKYRLIIQEWGSWALFQVCLSPHICENSRCLRHGN